jgi:hypothetical protein
MEVRMVMRLPVALVMLLPLAQVASAQSAADDAYKQSMLAHKLTEVQTVVTSPLGGMFCVTGNSVEEHDVGLLPANAQVEIRFESNFDPVAAVMLLRLGVDSVTPPPSISDALFFDDDDSGGLLEPLINFTVPYDTSA